MTFIKFFLLLCCLFTFGYGIDLRAKYSHEIIRSFEKKIIQKGFRPIGIGEGIDHDSGKQNYLKIAFYVEKLPSIPFARKLILESINDFLFEINSHEKMRPYLVEYPFSIKYIKISIYTRDDKQGLACVSNYKDSITYNTNNPEPYTLNWVQVHEETFEEAQNFLNRSK